MALDELSAYALYCEEETESEVWFVVSNPVFYDDHAFANLMKMDGISNPIKRIEEAQSNVRTDRRVDVKMRLIVVEWLFDVVKALHLSNTDIVVDAMSYLDRMLQHPVVRKGTFQTLASACLLLAHKLNQGDRTLTPHTLAFFGGGAFNKKEVVIAELCICRHLKWNLGCITSNAFIECIVDRLSCVKDKTKLIIATRQNVNHLLVYEMAFKLPSVVAGGRLLYAAADAKWNACTSQDVLVHQICDVIRCKASDVLEVLELMFDDKKDERYKKTTAQAPRGLGTKRRHPREALQ